MIATQARRKVRPAIAGHLIRLGQGETNKQTWWIEESLFVFFLALDGLRKQPAPITDVYSTHNLASKRGCQSPCADFWLPSTPPVLYSYHVRYSRAPVVGSHSCQTTTRYAI